MLGLAAAGPAALAVLARNPIAERNRLFARGRQWVTLTRSPIAVTQDVLDKVGREDGAFVRHIERLLNERMDAHAREISRMLG